MLTIHAVPASDPVLVGLLQMHRSGPIKGQPALRIDVWCGWCKEFHSAEAEVGDAPFPLDAVVFNSISLRIGSIPRGRGDGRARPEAPN